MGTIHGFEIPFTIDVPGALVGDKRRRGHRSAETTARSVAERMEPAALTSALASKPFGCPRFGFRSFFFPILRRGIRLQLTEKLDQDACNLIYRSQEHSFVSLRRLVEPSDLSHVLQRRRPRLVFGHGRIKLNSVLMFLHIPFRLANEIRSRIFDARPIYFDSSSNCCKYCCQKTAHVCVPCPCV